VGLAEAIERVRARLSKPAALVHGPAQERRPEEAQ
jgi:hypothetical protein